MAVITKDDFVGENKKCSYVLAYFKSHHLNVGDEKADHMKAFCEEHGLF